VEGLLSTGLTQSSFRKVLKNVRPYLAIFLEKNANLLGVFLKQYKKGQFFKLIFWYVLKFLKVSEQSRIVGSARLKKCHG
jgi:hypothetical protein